MGTWTRALRIAAAAASVATPSAFAIGDPFGGLQHGPGETLGPGAQVIPGGGPLRPSTAAEVLTRLHRHAEQEAAWGQMLADEGETARLRRLGQALAQDAQRIDRTVARLAARRGIAVERGMGGAGTVVHGQRWQPSDQPQPPSSAPRWTPGGNGAPGPLAGSRAQTMAPPPA